MARIPEGFGYIAAYLGGVATILVLQALQPQTRVVVVPGGANLLGRPSATLQQRSLPADPPSQPVAADPVQQAPAAPAPAIQPTPPVEPIAAPVPACSSDRDCASPTAFCAIRFGVCEELRSPACACGDAYMLRCVDAANRSKQTPCEKGCMTTPDGSKCVK
jgi:hypothetical protein